MRVFLCLNFKTVVGWNHFFFPRNCISCLFFMSYLDFFRQIGCVFQLFPLPKMSEGVWTSFWQCILICTCSFWRCTYLSILTLREVVWISIWECTCSFWHFDTLIDCSSILCWFKHGSLNLMLWRQVAVYLIQFHLFMLIKSEHDLFGMLFG